MEAVGGERRKRAEEESRGRASAQPALAARTAANMAALSRKHTHTHKGKTREEKREGERAIEAAVN